MKRLVERIFLFCARRGLFDAIPDKEYLKLVYRIVFGKKLNLIEPKSFNEKLQWLKLYDRDMRYSNLVDKYKVRNYIKNTIGSEYLVPLLGIWEKADDIDFEKLPNQFVLKCNHDSGSVVICNNKYEINQRKVVKSLNRHMKRGTYFYGREWPYKNVKPCIMAEKLLRENNQEDIRDYKFFCFNGEPKFFKIDIDRFRNHHANYYTCQKELLPFEEEKCPRDLNAKIDFPQNLDTMIELARKISKGYIFLRVDFYEVLGRVYFGEITFYPGSGFGHIVPERWDEKIGELIEIK